MYRKLSENNCYHSESPKRYATAGLFFSFLLILSLACFSQTGKYPVKRIRTFQQEEVSGTTSGRDRVRQKKLFHWIYLELWPGKSIEITHLWINNEATGFRVEKISSPVFQPNSEITEKKVVIPETTNEVIQLIKTDELTNQGMLTQSFPASYRRFPILIRYISEGKIFYLGTYPRKLAKERKQ